MKISFITSIISAVLGVIFLLLAGYFNSIGMIGHDVLDVYQGICAFLFFAMIVVSVVSLILGFVFKSRK